MNKKVLLGSIIAVVILVMVSFTGVVGYQTTKSFTTARASPLFNIRTSRAIDEETEDIACDYIGKGVENSLSIPKRASETSGIQNAINIISTMDDRTFKDFVARFIPYLKNHEQMSDKETLDVLQAIQHIRENPNVMEYYDKKNNPIDETGGYLSYCWFPGCNVIYRIILILIVINILISVILDFIQTVSNPTCFLTCEYIPHFCPWPE